MPKKKYNFTSINIPAYLVRDIDEFISSDPNLRGLTTRAGLVSMVLNEFLDKKATEREKDLTNDKKSDRTKRNELVEWFDNLTMKEARDNPNAEMFNEDYAELTDKIETISGNSSKRKK